MKMTLVEKGSLWQQYSEDSYQVLFVIADLGAVGFIPAQELS